MWRYLVGNKVNGRGCFLVYRRRQLSAEKFRAQILAENKWIAAFSFGALILLTKTKTIQSIKASSSAMCGANLSHCRLTFNYKLRQLQSTIFEKFISWRSHSHPDLMESCICWVSNSWQRPAQWSSLLAVEMFSRGCYSTSRLNVENWIFLWICSDLITLLEPFSVPFTHRRSFISFMFTPLFTV